jgi:hypothetical protein
MEGLDQGRSGRLGALVACLYCGYGNGIRTHRSFDDASCGAG